MRKVIGEKPTAALTAEHLNALDHDIIRIYTSITSLELLLDNLGKYIDTDKTLEGLYCCMSDVVDNLRAKVDKLSNDTLMQG